MSIAREEHVCWTVRCDRCEEAVGDPDYGSVTHYSSAQEARQAFSDQDGFTASNGLLICWSCAEDASYWEVVCPACNASREESCAPPGAVAHAPCIERVEALAIKLAAEKALTVPQPRESNDEPSEANGFKGARYLRDTPYASVAEWGRAQVAAIPEVSRCTKCKGTGSGVILASNGGVSEVVRCWPCGGSGCCDHGPIV